MKRFAQILIVMFLALALKPSLDVAVGYLFSAECTMTEACESKGNDGCEGVPCNPMQVCSSCLYVPVFAKKQAFKIELPISKYYDLSEVVASEFIPEFWQPPKIV